MHDLLKKKKLILMLSLLEIYVKALAFMNFMNQSVFMDQGVRLYYADNEVSRPASASRLYVCRKMLRPVAPYSCARERLRIMVTRRNRTPNRSCMPYPSKSFCSVFPARADADESSWMLDSYQ